MENALSQVDAIRQGQMFGPLDPDRKLPYTAARDMDVAAARMLRDRSWTGREDVPLLGPEGLSCNDVAAMISTVVGHDVLHNQLSFDGFTAQL